ncbi:hypothetical protein [Mangrovibrevibacter kandeliae]|uniref:hypothetical protein n=1 Tax=Mangrovibrevibacter kandeliae TaxID=2968473 RepID=UPI002119384F|nr:hypothetical protein [Aurantimonas sp. CSK15Z-1]MCQ8781707.1 hypothetical protein [Aurantimonas sp. CSK15Z-1]
MAYAKETTVSVEKTEAEIKALLRRYGATAMMAGEQPGQAMIAFEMKDRRIVFRLPLPDRDAKEFRLDGRGAARTADRRLAAWEQACRSRWRALLLCIKAKLESVESGIESFEQAFMPHIMLPDGSTVSEQVLPRIAESYRDNKMQPLLPAPKEG